MKEELALERVRPLLWSVTDTGIVFVTREPDFDAVDVYGSAIGGLPEWADSDFGYRRASGA